MSNRWQHALNLVLFILLQLAVYGQAHGQDQTTLEKPVTSTRRQQRKAEVYPPVQAPQPSADAQADVPLRLPPLPDGVAELKFNEIFQRPVGPLGLEYTERAKSLDGKKVRILGFMVKQGIKMNGKLLFAPYPMITHESEYGLAEDLPPSTIVVDVPTHPDLAVPYTPGLLLLTGTLSLGPRNEPDGRVSHVRLLLDPPSHPQNTDLLPEYLVEDTTP